jgi:hypothetical protein
MQPRSLGGMVVMGSGSVRPSGKRGLPLEVYLVRTQKII